MWCCVAFETHCCLSEYRVCFLKYLCCSRKSLGSSSKIVPLFDLSFSSRTPRSPRLYSKYAEDEVGGERSCGRF